MTEDLYIIKGEPIVGDRHNWNGTIFKLSRVISRNPSCVEAKIVVPGEGLIESRFFKKGYEFKQDIEYVKPYKQKSLKKLKLKDFLED